MRKKIIAGNWKMNTIVREGVALASDINNRLKGIKLRDEVEVVIAPPFTHLSFVKQVINNEKIMVAAQNCATEEEGAYTGEISARMLKMLACDAVILGHSERRVYYHETSETLFKKTNQVLANDMIPIFCCGEMLNQREAGNHFNIIETQVSDGLFHLSENDFAKVVIAYEPVWAIGTGVTASKEQAQEMHEFIRKIVKTKYGSNIAENLTILYGGSVKPSNAKELFSQPDVDGGLIGGASLKSDSFVDIIKAI